MLRSSAPVYLDWAATTPLCEESAKAMACYLEPGIANVFCNANANSLHTPGRNAFTALEKAHADMAHLLHASRPTEIVFTSGATESDNAAVLGMLSAVVRKRRQKGELDFVPHFITSAIEHDAVLSLIPVLKARGCEVTVVKPNHNGFVSCESIRSAMRDNTVLVSVMAANNEVGSIQDVKGLSACAHENGALFHTDATQALGKIPVDFAAWDVDAASLSAHKVCGPKGVGALYLRNGVPFDAQMLGGGQELGRRSGTQNVMGAVGFVAAADAAVRMLDEEALRLRVLRDELYVRLTAIRGVVSSVECREGDGRFLPNIVNVTVDGIESETLILQLDLQGYAISGGSACSSSSLEPSHVLTALGMKRDRALCSLRVSIGRYTTREDIEGFVQAFKTVVGA